MYGPDYAYHEITGQHAEVMRQPYYGLVTNYDKLSNPMPGLSSPVDYSSGFLAVITEGDSLASLKAEVGVFASAIISKILKKDVVVVNLNNDTVEKALRGEL